MATLIDMHGQKYDCLTAHLRWCSKKKKKNFEIIQFDQITSINFDPVFLFLVETLALSNEQTLPRINQWKIEQHLVASVPSIAPIE